MPGDWRASSSPRSPGWSQAQREGGGGGSQQRCLQPTAPPLQTSALCTLRVRRSPSSLYLTALTSLGPAVLITLPPDPDPGPGDRPELPDTQCRAGRKHLALTPVLVFQLQGARDRTSLFVPSRGGKEAIMGAQVGQAEDAPGAPLPPSPVALITCIPPHPGTHQRPSLGHRHHPLIACPQSWELGTAPAPDLPAPLGGDRLTPHRRPHVFTLKSHPRSTLEECKVGAHCLTPREPLCQRGSWRAPAQHPPRTGEDPEA